MDTFTRSYVANPDAYIIEMRAAYLELLTLFDANANNKLEIEEHVRFFKAMGHVSNAGDMESFRVAYGTADSVPLDVARDTWHQWRTGIATTANNDTIDLAIKTALHEEL